MPGCSWGPFDFSRYIVPNLGVVFKQFDEDGRSSILGRKLVCFSQRVIQEIAKGTVPLLGSGAPGAKIQVLIDEQLVGSAQVDGTGFWFLTIELTEPGTHSITLQTVTQGELVMSSEPVAFVIVEEE
jgi:hypothetical protein